VVTPAEGTERYRRNEVGSIKKGGFVPEETITKEDVEQLAAKLDTIGEQLSEKEKVILLTVFRVAGSAMAEQAEEVAGFNFGSPAFASVAVNRLEGSSLPSLSHGFNRAFEFGQVGGRAMDADVTVDAGVTVKGTG
jgi:hypothetical protein